MADGVSKITKEGEDLGLILNTFKCELIIHHGFNVQGSTPRSFHRVEMEETILLGAPLSIPLLTVHGLSAVDRLRNTVPKNHCFF